MASRTLKDVLNEQTIHKYLERSKQELVFLKSNDPVEKAIEDSGDFIGFVHMLDILSFIIRMYTMGTNEPPQAETWLDWCKDIDTLNHRGVRFGIKPVGQIISGLHCYGTYADCVSDQSGEDPYFPVSEHGTLYQVTEELFSRGIHRVPVMDDQSHIHSILSQSDVVSYLSTHLLGCSEASKTVSELGVINDTIISMSFEALPIHAFYLMLFNKVNAVAITSPQNGALLGNLSVSDLRSLPQHQFSMLLLPVREFISRRIAIAVPDRPHMQLQVRKPPVTVSPKTSLQTVLQLMVMHRIHRVWVVDEHQKPTGVISTTDIMKMVARE